MNLKEPNVTAIKDLFVYLGSDGNPYAVSQPDLGVYPLSAPGAAGVEEAPLDGEAYVRQNAAWTPDKGTPGRALVLSDGINQITLSIGPYGDLWVTQEAGPNAGKSANLTYGKWA